MSEIAPATGTTGAPAASRSRWRWLFFLPVVALLGLAVILGIGLTRDAKVLPSALIDDPVPDFALPPLPGRDGPGLTDEQLVGEPMLVNFFASWCMPCRIEHPILERLAADGVTVHGIDYKDQPEAARAFLAELGDPYSAVGADRDGRVGIEFGVYGVPETYVIDASGRVVYRHVGPIQERDLNETIAPILEGLHP